ncbi:hypothetical protein [Vibrio harveyi]|uniref:hypothetical protein n=1 Tax=Vibrio harveyi TaxID=669 RepID=UPI003BB7FD71
MKKISGSFICTKIITPILAFGFTSLLLILPLLGMKEPQMPHPILLFPVGLIIVLYAYFKLYVWSTYDDVYDEGSFLVFKKKRKIRNVYIDDILTITHSIKGHYPEKISIVVRNNDNSHDTLSFLTPFRLSRITTNPILVELRNRANNKH